MGCRNMRFMDNFNQMFCCCAQKEDDIIQSRVRVSWRSFIYCVCRGWLTRTTNDWSRSCWRQLRYDSSRVSHVYAAALI